MTSPTTFRDVFGNDPEGVWLAPGRANVIGEHTDYNDGFVLPIALPHRVLASVARRTDGLLRIASVQQPGAVVELPMTEVRAGNPAGWAGYVAGVAEQFDLPGGLSVLVDGDVPAGAGLSSSAAVTCSVALALRDLLRPDLPLDALVDIARRAENDFVGAPTGILDQSASLLCEAGHALFLDTRDRSRQQVPLDLAAAGLALLVVDTGHTHSHADGGYGDRRRECERAAEALGVPALRDATPEAVEALADDVLRRRARHIVTDDERVLQVVGMLTGGGDPRAIGPVLTAGHVSLRDDFEISTPELDAVVDTALAAGAHGARMVGGGFGGSAIVLVETADLDAVTAAVQPAGGSYRTFVAVPSPGAHRVA